MSGKKSKRMRKVALAQSNLGMLVTGKVVDANKEYERLKKINRSAPHNQKPIK